jgi:pyruvate/2-oxoglutarate/acetoin dehydrogenase E1 component
MAVRDAINAAIDEEMARDKRVFVMGEVNVPSVPFSVHSPPSYLTFHGGPHRKLRSTTGLTK